MASDGIACTLSMLQYY